MNAAGRLGPRPPPAAGYIKTDSVTASRSAITAGGNGSGAVLEQADQH
ncbi:MAG TPA: hypothetical protein VMV09_06325 [Candidatus Saccharimonadales bacterium]|nr:hypothetical protein [Candidatus Saccharimonadales bacterium]